MRTFSKALSYNQIGMAPRKVSTKPHRSDLDTSAECFDVKLDYPLIASPMPDVCNGYMAQTLAGIGCMGIIHRFQTIDDQLHEYTMSTVSCLGNGNLVACAIGATGDYQERFEALYTAGCRIFCIDTANGANTKVEEAIRWLREYTNRTDTLPRIYIIAGNVATREGYRFLAELPVDAVRVGIAGGSQCTTKNKTGVYVPMVTSILECVEEREAIAEDFATEITVGNTYGNRYEELYIEKFSKLPLIIADGGITEPADVNKALALGADLVMAGGVFVPYDESPAEIVKFEGVLYKKYRGAASFGVQKEFTGQNPKYSEGAETLIRYERNVSVVKMIEDYKSGLQSNMSYFDAQNLTELRENAEFVLV